MALSIGQQKSLEMLQKWAGRVVSNQDRLKYDVNIAELEIALEWCTQEFNLSLRKEESTQPSHQERVNARNEATYRGDMRGGDDT